MGGPARGGAREAVHAPTRMFAVTKTNRGPVDATRFACIDSPSSPTIVGVCRLRYQRRRQYFVDIERQSARDRHLISPLTASASTESHSVNMPMMGSKWECSESFTNVYSQYAGTRSGQHAESCHFVLSLSKMYAPLYRLRTRAPHPHFSLRCGNAPSRFAIGRRLRTMLPTRCNWHLRYMPPGDISWQVIPFCVTAFFNEAITYFV
jgi:hypothetical protein